MGCQWQRHANNTYLVFEYNLFSFLQKSPKTVVKVDSIQVSVCGTSDQISESNEQNHDNCSSPTSDQNPTSPQPVTSKPDTEVMKDCVTCETVTRDPADSSCCHDNKLPVRNSLPTNNLQGSSKINSQTENLLHPRAAKNGINTLNLPELIGRREKLV